jgi:hypothetical protein
MSTSYGVTTPASKCIDESCHTLCEVHVYLHLLSRVCLHTYDSAGTPSNTENTLMYQALVGTQGPCGLRNAPVLRLVGRSVRCARDGVILKSTMNIRGLP